MFGRRYDGRAVKDIDPIVALTPYLMPMRCDAQVMFSADIAYEPLARYIVEKGQQGEKLTFMELFIAAFVRTVSQLPEVNRFIVNKRLYVRNHLSVSFVVLKSREDGAIEENCVKCSFDPRDTIFDVASRIRNIIEEARKEEADNSTLRIAKLLLHPVLATPVVSLMRLLDRYGIMPKFIVEASPFHTSMFMTNMASIGMPAVNHHIYNFGTTTMFWSIGAVQRVNEPGPDGKPSRRRILPVGVTADERICAGAVYAKLMASMLKLLKDPAQLEAPVENVIYDEGRFYGLEKPGKSRKRLKKTERISA